MVIDFPKLAMCEAKNKAWSREAKGMDGSSVGEERRAQQTNERREGDPREGQHSWSPIAARGGV